MKVDPAGSRILVQALLLLPSLAAVGVLPMLFLSVPDSLAEGNWRGAVFNALALPGFVALVASVVLPQAWQLRPAVRRALTVGLVAAGTACVTLLVIMMVGTDGRLRPPSAPIQLALVGWPLVVAVWNSFRLAGRRFVIAACACGLIVLSTSVWVMSRSPNGCVREYDSQTGEHTACL